jgi:DNA-binding CsgD family transcriptional regulator
MAMLPFKQSDSIPMTFQSRAENLAVVYPYSWRVEQGLANAAFWDRAAAISRIAQLEEENKATLKDLHNAQADLKRIYETLQSGPATRSGPAKCDDAGVSADAATASALRHQATTCVASLTSRQREVLDLVLAGHPSKIIAADLGISQRTVDNHRAAIMRKTGSKSVPALVRTALAAA